MTAGRAHHGRASVDWAVSAQALAGEAGNGDCATVHVDDDGATVLAVVDGLGHGPAAARASATAISAIREGACTDLRRVCERTHDALRQTRGAALTIARIDGRQLSWVGIGNVDARIWPAGDLRTRSSLITAAGVVGYRLPPLRVDTVDLSAGDTLVITTDGIAPGSVRDVPCAATVDAVAASILADGAHGADDALVLVARRPAGTQRP